MAALALILTIRCSAGVQFANVTYIGMSSMTEGVQTSGTSFRGSFYALNTNDGTQKWRSEMCPAGYTGCSMWGSSPVVDVRRYDLSVLHLALCKMCRAGYWAVPCGAVRPWRTCAA